MTIINKLKKQKLFLGIVIVPMLLAILYFGFLARDRYTSSSQVVVKKVGSSTDSSSDDSGGAGASISGLALMVGGDGGTGFNEAIYVQQYIMSTDMLDILQKKLNWASHYSGHIGDAWYYLPADAPQEKMLKYYERMVHASVDETSGILTIQVQAFDQDFAKKTLQTIMAASDDFVNRISNQIATMQVRFAENQLDKTRHTLEEKRNLVLKFQSNNNLLDAQQSALAQNTLIQTLQQQLVHADTTLRALQASLSQNSPQIRQQMYRVDAIRKQIDIEESKLVARKSNDQLNVIASEFQALQVDESIAQDAYTTAVASLNSARIQAASKLRTLVVIVSPNLPEESLFPRRLYDIFTSLIVLLLFYGITRFVIATVNDHRD